MQKLTAYCDICGKAKGDNNHWFKAMLVIPGCFTVWEWDAYDDAASDGEDRMKHLCSESCVVKMLDKLMFGGSQT